jgi:hypothetical protein
MGLDRGRLARVLEMIGSSFDGEALVAAKRAHELVKGAGKTWDEVLNSDETRHLREECDRLRRLLAQTKKVETPDSLSEKLDLCAEYHECLTDWEKKFIESLAAWRGQPTVKQAQRLDEVLRKVRVYARMQGNRA